MYAINTNPSFFVLIRDVKHTAKTPRYNLFRLQCIVANSLLLLFAM